MANIGLATLNADSRPKLYYYRARYYDTATGRFASEDPLSFDGMTSNFYTYVANDPLDYWDPLGLRPLTACEKVKLAPYIPLIDLNNADIIEDEWPPKVAKFFPIPFLQNEAGITLGNKIYIRPGQYDSSTIEGMELLGHELVHVGQYRTGVLTKSKYIRELMKHGSDVKNKYEAPGYAMDDDIKFSLPAYLLALKQKGCMCAQ